MSSWGRSERKIFLIISYFTTLYDTSSRSRGRLYELLSRQFLIFGSQMSNKIIFVHHVLKITSWFDEKDPIDRPSTRKRRLVKCPGKSNQFSRVLLTALFRKSTDNEVIKYYCRRQFFFRLSAFGNTGIFKIKNTIYSDRVSRRILSLFSGQKTKNLIG